MNLVNVCSVAAFIIYKNAMETKKHFKMKSRRSVLMDLAEQLVHDQVMSNGAKKSKGAFKQNDEEVNTSNGDNGKTRRKRRRCYHCSVRRVNRKTAHLCEICKTPTCNQHANIRITCIKCNIDAD